MSFARVKMSSMLATVLALSVGCSAQAPKVIAQKLCDRLDQSWANHDLNHVFVFYDSSFVIIDKQGKSETLAEMRKGWEQAFPRFRNMKPSTTVQDVRFEADRMVVSYKHGSHYEYNYQNQSIPQIY